MVRTFNYPSLTFFFLDHGFYFHASLKALQVFYYILDIVEKAVDYSSIIYLSIYKTIIHCYDHCFFIKQWPFIFIFKKLYFLLLFIPVFTYWLSYVLSLNNFFGISCSGNLLHINSLNNLLSEDVFTLSSFLKDMFFSIQNPTLTLFFFFLSAH